MIGNGKGKGIMKIGKAMLAAAGILWIATLMAGRSHASDRATDTFLKATPEQFDAGAVAEGKKVEVTVAIQNVGKTQVEITNVKTS
jgi:hypothetical protein